MENLLTHLKTMNGCSFYAAPDNAKVTPVRARPETELVEMITGGMVSFEWEGQWREFRRGTIFWHRAGEFTVHRTTEREPYRCAAFEFRVAGAVPPAPRVSFWNAEFSCEDFAADCVNSFHRGVAAPEVLALYAYGTLLRSAAGSEPQRRAALLPEALTVALEAIAAAPGGWLPVGELAAASGVSVPYLFALFRRHMKCSPHRYMLGQQLARARTLLAGGELSIKAVAAECGFATLEVFYRRFRDFSGMTPGDYRKRNTFR